MSQSRKEFSKRDIPKRWQFEERTDPNLGVIDLDEEMGYLSLITDRTATDNYSGPAMVDYIFDQYGGPKSTRRVFGDPALDLAVYQLDYHGELPIRIWIPVDPPADSKISVKPIEHNPLELVQLVYQRGNRLKLIQSGPLFCAHPVSGMVSSPIFRLNTEDTESPANFELSIDSQGQDYIVGPTPIFGPDGLGYMVFEPDMDTPIYQASWRVRESEEVLPDRLPKFETDPKPNTDRITFKINRDDQVTKFITAPIVLSREVTRKAMGFARNNEGQVVIPWDDLDQKIAVSLGYSGDLRQLRSE